MKAFHYIRWSSDKQSHGSTLRRQQNVIRKLSDEMNWSFEREIRDEAVSAYFGNNLDAGNLGDFIRLCEAEGGEGRVLVCEMISRISRLNSMNALLNIHRMIETGLTVAIADQSMVIDKQTIRNQRSQLTAIVESQDKAHQEIEQRVRLILAAWQDMRDRGLPVHCSSTCPAWLELDSERTRFLSVTELSAKSKRRIALLNEILDLYIDGHGFRAIARLLNIRGEPTWRGGLGWQASAVRALIHNRSLIGEYQHRVGGQPVGDPVSNYFPQVVSNEKFSFANDVGHRRIMASHSRTSKLSNLVSEVGRCAHCGGRMAFHNKSRRKDGQPVAYLQCDTYSRGLSCASRVMLPYYPFENALLDTILERILEDQHFRSGDEMATVQQTVADMQRIIDDANRRVENVGGMIERHNDNAAVQSALERRFLRAVADLDEATAAMIIAKAELERATGRANRAEHLARVADIRAALQSEDDDLRRRSGQLIKMAINDYVRHIDVDTSTACAHVELYEPIGDFQIARDNKVVFFDPLHPWRDQSRTSPLVKRLSGWKQRAHLAA